MTESRVTPYTWVGQEVHLIHQTGNDRRGVNYTLAEVNDLGVCLEGSADSFLSVEQHPEIWPRPSTTEQGHELIVRRFEQCPSEDVLADTIVKGKLPGTGGPSPLLVLGLAAVALGAVAGIVVLRRS